MEFVVLNNPEIMDLPQVRWNFEELKKYALEKAEEYKSIAYTEDDVASMKADRADINRFIKAVNAERIQKKKQYMEPYNAFERQVKEVLKPLEEAEALIARGLKEIDDRWREERKKSILEIYERTVGDLKNIVSADDIMDETFFKKTTSMKKIEECLKAGFDTVKMDTDELYALPEQYQAAAIRAYKTSGRNLSAALAEVRRIQEEEKNIEERKRRDAELKAKATAIHEEYMDAVEKKPDGQPQAEVAGKDSKDPILQLDFRVYGTRDQIIALRDFMVATNIKFGRLKG